MHVCIASVQTALQIRLTSSHHELIAASYLAIRSAFHPTVSLSLAALQRDCERVPHAGGAAVRRRARRAGDLLDALRDQLRDALQDLRDRAGRARLHHGAHEEVQQHHA